MISGQCQSSVSIIGGRWCSYLSACAVVNVKDLEALRAKVREMEEEAEKIRAMQIDVEKQMSVGMSSVGQYTIDTPSSVCTVYYRGL